MENLNLDRPLKIHVKFTKETGHFLTGYLKRREERFVNRSNTVLTRDVQVVPDLKSYQIERANIKVTTLNH